MAEVINLTMDHGDETFLGSFVFTGYLDEATGIVTLDAYATRGDGDARKARSYLYPEDVKQLMDAHASGDSETSARIFKAVASDLGGQLGFEIL